MSLQTEPPVSEPWQFSLKAVWIAVAFLAAACGMAALVIKSFATHADTAFAAGIFAVPVLLAGAFGVLAGKLVKWLIYGTVVSLFLVLAVLHAEYYFAVGPILILVFATRKYQAKVAITPAQAVARRQASIYRLSAVCSVVLLVFWLPIIFVIAPGGGCRPMGQAMVTILFVLPATVINSLRAIRQFITNWPEKRLGVQAIAAALVPIAVYAFTQWLILSAFGIFYEE